MSNVVSAVTGFVGNTSPKVKAGLNWGTLAALVLALSDMVTPDMFAWAGPYQTLLFSAVPLVAGQVAAWLKTDPLRVAGAAVKAAQAAASTPPAPPAA